MNAGPRLPRRAPRRPPTDRDRTARPPEPLGRAVSPVRQAVTILRTELRGLLRDRRALVAGVLLPIVLYPLIFLGQSWLDRTAKESLDSKEVEVVVALDGVPAELGEALRAGLLDAGPMQVRDADVADVVALYAGENEPTSLAEREAVRAVLGETGDALLVALTDERLRFVLYADRADDRANAARDRLRDVLGELAETGRAARIDELLGGDPAAALDLEVHDVSTAQDVGGLALGKLLPFLAVLVVLSSASFAALAAFAGEREAGTLEGLLVQPVPARAIALGKLAAVALVGAATLLLNIASVLGSLALGLGELPGASGALAGAGSVGWARMSVAALLMLPAVVLLASALSLVAARARTFREGQHYVLPLILVAVLPVALGAQGELELDVLLALIPLTGVTMAMRDALAGDLVPWLGVVAFVAHIGWAAWLSARVATRLEAERLLAGSDLAEEAGRRHLASHAAQRFGWAAVIALYLLGGFLQTKAPVWGLAATLWGILLPLAFFAAARIRRHTGESFAATLGFRTPSPLHVVGALLVAPGLARLMAHYGEWQEHVLPLPSWSGTSAALEAFSALPMPVLVLLLAVTPAVCEEIFFRGSVLSGLRRDLSPALCVAWQALLFGLAHASIHRLVPTAILGALLAVVMLRARSIYVVIALHGAYNGWLVTQEVNASFDSAAVPWLAVLGAALLAWPRRVKA